MARTMVTRARLGSWLAAMVALLISAGCGASTDAPAAKESAAYASVITRADAICRRLNSELVANLPKHYSMGAVASISPRNAALERGVVSELAKLEPPASIAGEWRQVIAYRSELANALTQVALAAKARNTAAVKRLGVSKARVRKQLLAVGEHVGFRACQEIG
jgi:hypothetical protein